MPSEDIYGDEQENDSFRELERLTTNVESMRCCRLASWRMSILCQRKKLCVGHGNYYFCLASRFL